MGRACTLVKVGVVDGNSTRKFMHSPYRSNLSCALSATESILLCLYLSTLYLQDVGIMIGEGLAMGNGKEEIGNIEARHFGIKAQMSLGWDVLVLGIPVHDRLVLNTLSIP